MPEQLQVKNLHFKCISVEPLHQGWQQWLIAPETDFSFNPKDRLSIDDQAVYLLWQNKQQQLLCVLPSATIQKIHDKEFTLTYQQNPNQLEKMTTEQFHAQHHLMICHGYAIFSAIHQIYRWKNLGWDLNRVVVVSEALDQWPILLKPSKLIAYFIPNGAIGSIDLLDDWKILARFCSEDDLPGCFSGSLAEFEQEILASTLSWHWNVIGYR
ncbi:MAG: hypothetical protein COW84_00300 [Gammaproteobacteria bacterium CG22_combo_CG10-13_8_21_14_all_40_8]|nr:MAG: hypothetical protein COW84_00300 [Gammaproteobacteria bacterium CG22_combo_CG10-13_8_21_14_all_40_8]